MLEQGYRGPMKTMKKAVDCTPGEVWSQADDSYERLCAVTERVWKLEERLKETDKIVAWLYQRAMEKES